jgi:hypothetical protein
MERQDYKEYFNLSYDQFIATNNIDSSLIDEHVSYQKIADATRINLPDNQFFYFKGGKLKMIYISGEALVNNIWSEFKQSTNANAPEKTGRSRAGKMSNQLIFAGLGFTASIAGDEVDFIEIYPSCTLQDYLDSVYQEPPKFIR